MSKKANAKMAGKHGGVPNTLYFVLSSVEGGT